MSCYTERRENYFGENWEYGWFVHPEGRELGSLLCCQDGGIKTQKCTFHSYTECTTDPCGLLLGLHPEGKEEQLRIADKNKEDLENAHLSLQNFLLSVETAHQFLDFPALVPDSGMPVARETVGNAIEGA